MTREAAVPDEVVRSGPAARAERAVVLLVAAHSVAVGLLLLLAPRAAVRFAGWGEIEPLFFARQAGVFHVVLGIGYLAEHLRSRGIVLLVAAKAAATLFLLAATAAGGVPWAVPFCGAADGLMGAAAIWAHRRASPGRLAAGTGRGRFPRLRQSQSVAPSSDATKAPESSS